MHNLPQLYEPGQLLTGKDFEAVPVAGVYRGMTKAVDPDGPLLAPPVLFVVIKNDADGKLYLCRPHEVHEQTRPEHEDAPLPQQ